MAHRFQYGRQPTGKTGPISRRSSTQPHHLALDISPELLAELDGWGRLHHPNRSEAVRALLRMGLDVVKAKEKS